MRNIGFIIVALALLVCSCRAKDQSAQNEGSTTDTSTPSWSLVELWKTDTLMRTCESVRYDPNREQIYVACINGKPWEKDGQGFIALLNPDGSIKSERWVEGLDAPKGMGIHGDVLFVADMDQVIAIGIEDKKIVKMPIPGAVQLNDVAVGSDGRIYFSDSETGWIWIMDKGMPEQWVKGDWERPNGLFVEEDRVLLASSRSQDLTVISLEDESRKVVATEIGHGDGVEFIGKEGHYLVTSWSGEIFLVLPDFSKISLLKTSEEGINSADIGFNMAEQTVYVPTFFDNRVVAYRLKKTGD